MAKVVTARTRKPTVMERIADALERIASAVERLTPGTTINLPPLVWPKVDDCEPLPSRPPWEPVAVYYGCQPCGSGDAPGRVTWTTSRDVRTTPDPVEGNR